MTSLGIARPTVPSLPAAAVNLALRLVLRSAWYARILWHRVARPLTMGVRVVVLDETDPAGPRVLLIRHSYIGGWHFPGGGVGKGESLRSAAEREALEEVGLAVACDPHPFGLFARFRHGASDHVAVFLAREWSGTPKPDGVEVLEACFFPLASPPPDTSPATLRRIQEISGNKQRDEHW